MRAFRVRFTVRWLMLATALVALAMLAVVKVCRDYPGPEKRVVALVASTVAATYGVASLRRPWISLVPILIIAALPSVDHPSFDIPTMSMSGCVLGWFIGAPAGWMYRLAVRPVKPRVDASMKSGHPGS